jgi:hypothetical protein
MWSKCYMPKSLITILSNFLIGSCASLGSWVWVQLNRNCSLGHVPLWVHGFECHSIEIAHGLMCLSGFMGLSATQSKLPTGSCATLGSWVWVQLTGNCPRAHVPVWAHGFECNSIEIAHGLMCLSGFMGLSATQSKLLMGSCASLGSWVWVQLNWNCSLGHVPLWVHGFECNST